MVKKIRNMTQEEFNKLPDWKSNTQEDNVLYRLDDNISIKRVSNEKEKLSIHLTKEVK